MCIYVYLYMDLNIRIHFLHISRVILTWASAFRKCPHYVELNVKAIFVKAGLYIVFIISMKYHILELQKTSGFLFIWLILIWMILWLQIEHDINETRLASAHPPARDHHPLHLLGVGRSSRRNLYHTTWPFITERKVSQMHSLLESQQGHFHKTRTLDLSINYKHIILSYIFSNQKNLTNKIVLWMQV